MNKLRVLESILQYCNYNIDPSNYDFTQPDAFDESGSGGVWDLAGVIASDTLDNVATLETDTDNYNYTEANLRSLLYNLMCAYKPLDSDTIEAIHNRLESINSNCESILDGNTDELNTIRTIRDIQNDCKEIQQTLGAKNGQ